MNQPITTPALVTLAQLTVSPEVQVRQRLDPITITRYANAIRSGQELPPIQVALVQGVLILVDGFHRVAAHESLGATEVQAEVTEASFEDALWMAAKANLQHGLPLKPSEVRQVFRVFIRTKQHHKGRGKLKSYREIGAELGRPHTTIRGWMSKDFPRIFAKYSGNEEFKGEGGLMDVTAPTGDAKKGLEMIQGFQQVFSATTCPDAKRLMQDALQSIATQLLGQGWEAVKSDF